MDIMLRVGFRAMAWLHGVGAELARATIVPAGRVDPQDRLPNLNLMLAFLLGIDRTHT